MQQRLNITATLTGTGTSPKNGSFGVFTFSLQDCPELITDTVYVGDAKTFTFCDGSTLQFIIHKWENKTGSKSVKEAVFTAIRCRKD